MRKRHKFGRPAVLAMLAGALAWTPPVSAVEVDLAPGGGPSGKFVNHTVESGETVWEIADRYGSSLASVMRENDIEDPRKIWVGTRLRIPIPVGTDPALDAEAKLEAEDRAPTDITALLGRCEAELRTAHFEQALATAGEARVWIEARNRTQDDPDRVRLEIASATAFVALGQKDAALESLERALIANPDLELDPALTSPKVLAVFRVARGRANSAP